MRKAFGTLLILIGSTACGESGGYDEILVPPPPDMNAPSDEAITTFRDHIAAGDITIDDSEAVHVTAPTEGQVLPPDTPFTFVFPAPLRHLCPTGEFVWLHFEGLTRPLDVFGGCYRLDPFTSWTPDEATWQKLSDASGPIRLTVTNAYILDDIVIEGPFRATTPTVTFSIGN